MNVDLFGGHWPYMEQKVGWIQCIEFHSQLSYLVVMPRASIHRKYLHPLVRCLSFCHALHSPFDEQTVPPPFIFIDYTVSHNVILFLFYCRYNTSLSHNTIVRMMMMNPIILIIKWYLPPVPGYKAGAGGGWPQSAPTWGTAGSWSSSYRS